MARKTGRKPRGDFAEKREWLSTRITKETRKALEGAAARGGRSLSQEIERRIVATFEEDYRKDKEPVSAALSYLLVQVAIMLPMSGDILSDLLKFEAFCAATVLLLERLKEYHKLQMPSSLPPNTTPESVLLAYREAGTTIGEVVWKQLRTMPDAPRGHKDDIPRGSWLYAYPSARRDLRVEFDEAEADAWLTRIAADVAKKEGGSNEQ
jgi:hypothetical protein